MVTTCIIFLFHNTSHWCFLPPSDLPTTYCDGKTIYSAAFNDFHSFFQCFCGPLPSISHFCTFFHLPLPSTPVWKSLSVYFLLFWCWYFLTYLTPLLLFCAALSINPAPASFFFFKKKKNSVLLFLSAFSGTFLHWDLLCSFVLICFLWDFKFLHWDLLCRICTFLSWTFALLVLFLAWGGWRFCSCCCCALGFGEN